MYHKFQHSPKTAPIIPTVTLEVKTVLINGKFPLHKKT